MLGGFHEFIHNWFGSELEFFGAIAALVYVWLAARVNVWNWPVAMLSTALYAVFFYNERLYSDAGLQLVFIGFQCFGLHFWLFKRSNKPVIKISRMRAKDWKIYVPATLIATILWALILQELKSDALMPWLDSLTTCISISAIILQSRKKIENWLWWIFVDIIYIPMYISQGFWVTAILYGIFVIMAVYGFRNWISHKETKDTKLDPSLLHDY